jgi:excisionase family DNA binding protein
MALQDVQAPQQELRASTGRLLHRRLDVLDMLQIGNTTFYRLVAEGKLEVVKIGTATRVTDESVQALIMSLREAA